MTELRSDSPCNTEYAVNLQRLIERERKLEWINPIVMQI